MKISNQATHQDVMISNVSLYNIQILLPLISIKKPKSSLALTRERVRMGRIIGSVIQIHFAQCHFGNLGQRCGDFHYIWPNSANLAIFVKIRCLVTFDRFSCVNLYLVMFSVPFSDPLILKFHDFLYLILSVACI